MMYKAGLSNGSCMKKVYNLKCNKSIVLNYS